MKVKYVDGFPKVDGVPDEVPGSGGGSGSVSPGTCTTNAFLTEPFPPLPSFPNLPAPLEVDGLSLLDILQTASPAQCPSIPQAVHVLVRFLSSMVLGLPVNFLPSTVDCNFLEVTVRTEAKFCNS